MAMSNGVTGGVFANLADLQASRPREDTQVSLNGDVYTIDQTNFGDGIAVNSLFANPVKMTLTSLLNSTRERQAGDIVEITGYSVAGDGGAASWKVTGNTITASQIPTQLSDAKCSDALGNEFALVPSSSFMLESIGYGPLLNGTNELRIALSFCIDNGVSVINCFTRDDVTITDKVVLDKSERINIDIRFRIVCSGENARVVVGSPTVALVNSNIFIKEIVGDLSNLPTSCLELVSMRYSSLKCGGLSRAVFGLLIRPDGGAVATSNLSIGWIVNNTEGIRLWDEAAFLAGGNPAWHTQGLTIDVGFVSSNQYGLRKKKETLTSGLGAPLDLIFVKGSFDENSVSDILDEMPDSRSWYQLLFHDNEDVFTTKSLDGIGIDTSIVVKHYRGAGASDDANMSITLGNESSGFISGALKSLKDAGSDGVLIESKTGNIGDDAVLSMYHNGTKTASLISRLTSANDSIIPIRVLIGGVFTEVLSINAGNVTPTGTYQLGTTAQPFQRVIVSDGYYVDGVRVVSEQGASVTNATGANNTDVINAILQRLRAHGLIGT